MIKIQTWVLSNQTRVRNYAIIAALAVIAVIYFVTSARQKEAAASIALSEVKGPLTSAEMPEPQVADSYLALSEEFAGTQAAARALLLGASVHFMNARYAEAQSVFEDFLSRYPDSPWIAQANFGVASSLDAQTKTEEAIEKYEEVRRRFPNEHVAEEARLSLGRLYEDSNRLEEAFQIYDEMARANPGGIGAEAGIRREDLVARFPHLAQTNPPALTLPPPATNAVPLQLDSVPQPADPAPPSPTVQTNQPLQIQLPPP